MWSSDKWERQKNSFLQIPAGTTPTAMFGTHVQYHKDQNHFLVVHETQIAVYETLKLECQKKVLKASFSFLPSSNLILVGHSNDNK